MAQVGLCISLGPRKMIIRMDVALKLILSLHIFLAGAGGTKTLEMIIFGFVLVKVPLPSHLLELPKD